MSKKIIIVATVILAIGGAVYFLVGKDVLLPPSQININAIDKSCLSDSDCVVVAKNCSSPSCGQVINQFSVSKYEKEGVKACLDYQKTSACEISTPKCLAGSCILSLPKVNQALPSFTIRQINQVGLPPGVYNTEAYVYNIYECPACPTGKFCATCLSPHLVLIQDQANPPLRKNEMIETQIIVRIPSPSEFTRASKYRFSIRIPAEYKFDETYPTGYDQNLQVVAYEPIISEIIP